MVELLEPRPATRRRSPNLLLHCGAHAVEFDQVASVNTPRATSTWQPIPHAQLVRTVHKTLDATALSIGTQAHSLSHDGLRYFGLMEIQKKSHGSDDYCLVLGLRNSHDKTFPAGIVAGAQVFVCDNLSFSGEVKFARKHTRFINRDLPQIVERAIGQLQEKWHHQDRRISAYKTAELDDRVAHDLVIRATDVGACSNKLIPSILKNWREPNHREFEERTVWSLFNSGSSERGISPRATEADGGTSRVAGCPCRAELTRSAEREESFGPPGTLFFSCEWDRASI